MKGVIKAPRNIITGAFTILISFIRNIELTAADIVVETLEGDALGHTKDSFGGSGANYFILCYLPDARKGKSRISVSGFDVAPVVVEYDTIKTVTVTWGDPMRRGRKIEIPVALDTAIANLRKRNFRLTPAAPYQLYGTGDAYSLVVPESVQRIAISGTVRKSNGIQAEIEETLLEVDRGTLN